MATDYRLTEDGGVILSLFGDIPFRDRRPDRRHEDPNRKRTHPLVASLGVWFDHEDPDDPTSPPVRVREVSLQLPEGISPTELQRFAWSRWLGVADAIVRAGGDINHPSWRSDVVADPETVSGKIIRAVYGEHGIGAPGRRPGRKGNPPELYERVAARYTELRLEGVRSPARQIAVEEGVSPNTVAGWIRKARQLGMLPPGRRSRSS